MAKKAESTLINMLLSLTVIAVVAGAILALVSGVTAEPIAKAEQAKTENAIKAVLPDFDHLETKDIDGIACNLAYTADNNLVDIAVPATSKKGFGGDLGIMYGCDAEGNITGYQVLKTAETPGLGAKADKWFQKGEKGDIIGKNPAEPLTVSKDGGQVDAITASTITSRAFLVAVNNAYKAGKATPIDEK